MCLGKKVKKVTKIVHFTYSPEAHLIVTKFGLGADFQDVINCAKVYSIRSGVLIPLGSKFGLSHRNDIRR